jgi:hypothetical protein
MTVQWTSCELDWGPRAIADDWGGWSPLLHHSRPAGSRTWGRALSSSLAAVAVWKGREYVPSADPAVGIHRRGMQTPCRRRVCSRGRKQQSVMSTRPSEGNVGPGEERGRAVRGRKRKKWNGRVATHRCCLSACSRRPGENSSPSLVET